MKKLSTLLIIAGVLLSTHALAASTCQSLYGYDILCTTTDSFVDINVPEKFKAFNSSNPICTVSSSTPLNNPLPISAGVWPNNNSSYAADNNHQIVNEFYNVPKTYDLGTRLVTFWFQAESPSATGSIANVVCE